MSQVSSKEIEEAVYARFDGVVPTVGGKVLLHSIVKAVLDELRDRQLIDLEPLEPSE